jgi:hypothetical protein
MPTWAATLLGTGLTLFGVWLINKLAATRIEGQLAEKVANHGEQIKEVKEELKNHGGQIEDCVREIGSLQVRTAHLRPSR